MPNQIRIIPDGSQFRVEVSTAGGPWQYVASGTQEFCQERVAAFYYMESHRGMM